MEGITLTEAGAEYFYIRKTHRNIFLKHAIAVGSLQRELHAVPWSFKSWKMIMAYQKSR
jgi:hypothetical protein